MASHLKNEPAVPSLIQQLVFREPPDRQSAQDERAGAEAQSLSGLVSVLPNQLDPLSLLQLLFRYDQVSAGLPKNGPSRLKTLRMGLAQTITSSPRLVGRVFKASFEGSK
jgi:hypothetical protein